MHATTGCAQATAAEDDDTGAGASPVGHAVRPQRGDQRVDITPRCDAQVDLPEVAAQALVAHPVVQQQREQSERAGGR